MSIIKSRIEHAEAKADRDPAGAVAIFRDVVRQCAEDAQFFADDDIMLRHLAGYRERAEGWIQTLQEDA